MSSDSGGLIRVIHNKFNPNHNKYFPDGVMEIPYTNAQETVSKIIQRIQAKIGNKSCVSKVKYYGTTLEQSNGMTINSLLLDQATEPLLAIQSLPECNNSIQIKIQVKEFLKKNEEISIVVDARWSIKELKQSLACRYGKYAAFFYVDSPTQKSALSDTQSVRECGIKNGDCLVVSCADCVLQPGNLDTHPPFTEVPKAPPPQSFLFSSAYAARGISFVDPQNTFAISRVDFPDGGKVVPGLNLEGTCANFRCPNKGKRIIFPIGMGQVNITQKQCYCFECGIKADLTTCGFTGCRWSCIGKKVDDYQVKIGEYYSVHQFHYQRVQDQSNMADWLKLIIVTKSLLEECPICLQQIGQQDQYVTKCLHLFHKTCISTYLQTVGGNNVLCPMCGKDKILR
eukprot:TRINITY_DN6786_c0_g1_i3.p1 TRINITY_DN6786_c0_g1~~TRINITY_DN6786_c0_g1_i3.p1  ORF type:complete len:398 (-),score=8.66 TRINITY_DN6786_c0_g1_i3:187-1380(-)